jgi:hypothetical protein
MIPENRKYFIVSTLVLVLFLVAILYFGVGVDVGVGVGVGIDKKEHFTNNTSNDDIYKNLQITRVRNATKQHILPGHCIISINIGYELKRDIRDDFIYGFQTELNKVVRSFGNIPIVGNNSKTLNLKNEITGKIEHLFKGYKIKIIDIINDNVNGNEDSNFLNNIMMGNPPTCIYVMTTGDTYQIEGVISTSMSPYENVKKIIKFLGIQSDYS